MARLEDTTMRDQDAVQEEAMMYGSSIMTEEELNEKYPNRPHNHSRTLPFRELYLALFNPLNENKKKPTGPVAFRRRGPDGHQNPLEARRAIIQRFLDRWRKEVGHDIFPAFRLIVPEKDRDRAMYGLKESALGKLLVRVMKIDKNSDDGYNLLHWKLPGLKSSSAMAGDFAGRCFEVINKRQLRVTPGDMTIAEVNKLLDDLSVAQKEESQRPIIEEFYKRMNAEEIMWLIRMILRQMKIGASEKTLFDIWHPDAENLFNISSSLKRVCWELYDPQVRLEGDDRGIHLMQCFVPQLAAFQMRSMEASVSKMGLTEEDPYFWIEEKLDGERMQLHMIDDETVPGGRKFAFWSRKAKDYTYLYGEHLKDETGSLTRFLGEAFHENVRNIILDGEMLAWDPKENAVVPFGHLKTAAISERDNPYAGGRRPYYVIFDCLYLNDRSLTPYTLRDRRKALSASISNIDRRFEIHPYSEATTAADIEPRLRDVVTSSGEGLVLKNPRSSYKLNERNEDWIKVKPEYMTEFGEDLDCVVIGGYYGSGHRGGMLSSFMCGLRVDQIHVDQGADPQKCWSFFKVGGGFSASDYAEMRHRTDGKWQDWDRRRPPTHLIELAGGDRQLEQPDVWIKPEHSVVVSVKAASVHATETFRTGHTLRFPRFKSIRFDKDWRSALSISEFKALKARASQQHEEKQFKVDDARRKRSVKRRREVVIQGQDKKSDKVQTAYAAPSTNVFDGFNFLVMTDAGRPTKKTRVELEQLIKANGGNIVASERDKNVILIADRKLVKVASIVKHDQRNIIRPLWVLDCIKQNEADRGRPPLVLPLEPKYFLHQTSAENGHWDSNVDEYGDSYHKDMDEVELLALLNGISDDLTRNKKPDVIQNQLIQRHESFAELPGWMLHGLKIYCDRGVGESIERLVRFSGGDIARSLDDGNITHVIAAHGTDVGALSAAVAEKRKRLPRIVSEEWVKSSFENQTRLDEEPDIGAGFVLP
ncbi:ATP-dependent DNA ligase [Polychaeton citri CBS 116435]|uniref:DNA ligase n=1 Tax=Polychaeton citri CBS 116435 TaxID=1314669 RepID=A0A9P4ULR3_9PEZI|nr:ATP-dependent DNA ligase [Polychaeton citri CBS 116435]